MSVIIKAVPIGRDSHRSVSASVEESLSRVSATAQARSAKTAQSDGRRQSVRAVAIGASLLSTLGKFGGDATLSELAAAAHLP